ncbi:uncharacterized protein [Nicotiana tomentosiformis]|uniref:uncharacterized protein n=1 Tax=Nicotiana tomentosiformis TaxID=4098 RepID=UPI00388C4CCB
MALSEQQDEALKDLPSLQAKMEKVQKEASPVKREHAYLVEKLRIIEAKNEKLLVMTNDATSQVQEKVGLIDQLQTEMDEVKATTKALRGRMDMLASKKEATKEEMASAFQGDLLFDMMLRFSMTQRKPNDIQDLLNRKRDREVALTFSEGASSRSPQPKDKKLKRKRTSITRTRRILQQRKLQSDKPQWSLLMNELMKKWSSSKKKSLHQLNWMVIQVNLFASEGHQKLILDKEELTTEQNQLIAEQNWLAKRLPLLEAKVAQMGELEARLENYEQERMVHIQEADQLHEDLKEAKSKVSPNEVINTIPRSDTFTLEAPSINKVQTSYTVPDTSTSSLEIKGWKRALTPIVVICLFLFPCYWTG